MTNPRRFASTALRAADPLLPIGDSEAARLGLALDKIRADAQERPRGYQAQTVVPEGGE